MDVTDEELKPLYQWVDEIPLSRPKRNIARDFADGGERVGARETRPREPGITRTRTRLFSCTRLFFTHAPTHIR